MAELRLDPTSHRWVLTGKRAATPDSLDSGKLCPFCPGNERFTPPPLRECHDGSGQWALRVFHDRAPLFRVEGGLNRRGEGLFDLINNVGAHEVVVESPEHQARLATLPPRQVERVVEVCRDRILDLKKDRRFRYVSLFKDQGPLSGAALDHPHSQIMAMPVLPLQVELEFRWSLFHYERKERCLYCDIIEQEMQQGKRVVSQSGEFLALCPFASRYPYELWLLPLRHSSSFEKDLTESSRVAALASFLVQTLQRVEKITPSFNMVAHTEPNLEARAPRENWWKSIPEDFHWHIEIVPRLQEVRRYLGTQGFFLNEVPAEEAAARLRGDEPSGGA